MRRNADRHGYRHGGTRIANFYTVFNSSIGRLGLAATEKGICRLEFNASEPRFRVELKKQWGMEPERRPERLKRVIRELKKYLTGKPVRFHARFDFNDATPFQKRVWLATLGIPFGKTKTYQEIARAIGKPRAFRAVGQALGMNPVPIIVPCHRVIGSNGDLVGFGGGIKLKKLKKNLLSLESIKKK